MDKTWGFGSGVILMAGDQPSPFPIFMYLFQFKSKHDKYTKLRKKKLSLPFWYPAQSGITLNILAQVRYGAIPTSYQNISGCVLFN